jgi:hypothetical protein
MSEAVTDEVVVEGAEKVKKKRKKYPVTDEQFVKAWSESNSAQEVADKLGMPKNIVLARSATWRNRGVKLKRMERKNPRRLDVDKLNGLIEG